MRFCARSSFLIFLVGYEETRTYAEIHIVNWNIFEINYNFIFFSQVMCQDLLKYSYWRAGFHDPCGLIENRMLEKAIYEFRFKPSGNLYMLDKRNDVGLLWSLSRHTWSWTARARAHTHTYMCTPLYPHAHILTYTHTCIHVYTSTLYTHTRKCTHTCIHTNRPTEIQTFSGKLNGKCWDSKLTACTVTARYILQHCHSNMVSHSHALTNHIQAIYFIIRPIIHIILQPVWALIGSFLTCSSNQVKVR